MPGLWGRCGNNENSNLERHYSAKHAKLDALKGQVHVEVASVSEFDWPASSFIQTASRQGHETQASFIVMSELIAKKLKPHAEGEFMECLDAAVELLAPEKIKLLQSVSLFQRTVSDRITAMAQDTEKSLKNSARDFQFFFSKLTLGKTQLCSKLTDPNLDTS